MIEMMFCNSDSVIWDIQHKEILYDIPNKKQELLLTCT